MGQSSKVVAKYNYGKELLAAENYLPAIEVFKKTADPENGNEIYLNSIYLHAYALYKTDQKQAARQLLFLLVDKHSTWQGLDEVHYLMAIIDFDWKATENAFEHITKIEDEQIQQNAYHLKKSKLSDDTIERLKYLYAKYPEDEALGRVLLAKLYEVDGGSDMTLLEDLQEKYNKAAPIKVEVNNNTKKEQYNVAILLPFNAENINGGTSSNFIIELYEGILIAVESLEEVGVPIKVYSYDTKRDSVTTAEILANSEFQKMDLIIGPLYGNTIPLVQRFSKANRIPFVNPISDNTMIIEDNPYGFLLSSGYMTKAKSIANYAANHLKGKTAVIVHGTSDKDTLAAKAFIDQFTANGGTVHKVFEYPDEYAYKYMVSELSDIRQDTSKFVYIASSNVALGRTSLSALRNILFEGVIIAPSRWIDIPQLSYTRLEAANVYFVDPNYYDDESQAAKQFTSQYIQKIKVLPTKFAFMGYESMSFFGRALYEYGTGFVSDIHTKTKVKSYLYQEINYQGGNDNQSIQLLKFENGELILVKE